MNEQTALKLLEIASNLTVANFTAVPLLNEDGKLSGEEVFDTFVVYHKKVTAYFEQSQSGNQGV
jgi:hypothetical protein